MAVTLPSGTVGNARILLSRPSLIDIFHLNSHGCGKDSEDGLIREQYMFHIVH